MKPKKKLQEDVQKFKNIKIFPKLNPSNPAPPLTPSKKKNNFVKNSDKEETLYKEISETSSNEFCF